jgi:hypothetical protein
MARAEAGENDASVNALRTVEAYVAAQLRDDIEAIVNLTSPEWVAAQGGSEAFITQERERVDRDAVYTLKPEWIALGRPKILRARRLSYALVPAMSLTRDFPEHLEERFYFLALSKNRGATWNVLDLSCHGARWAEQTFEGFPKAALQPPAARFDLVITVRPPRLRGDTREPTHGIGPYRIFGILGGPLVESLSSSLPTS